MMKFSSVLMFMLCMVTIHVYAQDEGTVLLDFEKHIDNAVVATDLSFLQTAYADDFRFKHGTGHVDNKTSWLNDVVAAKGKFVSRQIDSVEVEIHKNVGITNGRLTVIRNDNKAYIIKYVRVYVKDNDQWKMIMHRTVQQRNKVL